MTFFHHYQELKNKTKHHDPFQTKEQGLNFVSWIIFEVSHFAF